MVWRFAFLVSRFSFRVFRFAFAFVGYHFSFVVCRQGSLRYVVQIVKFIIYDQEIKIGSIQDLFQEG